MVHLNSKSFTYSKVLKQTEKMLALWEIDKISDNIYNNIL